MSMERIDKIFSNLGILSRSECRKAVKYGLITVNGIAVRKPEEKADPDQDVIAYKNERINSRTYVYYMLYKPSGYITAREDRSQPTVFDLITDTRTDLAAVGRLDKDTTGILLITNDGELNHRLLSPKHHVPKRYEVLIDGQLSDGHIAMLTDGIDIGDEKKTLPAILEVLTEESPQKVALTITEGRYHQVKRMFAAVGCPVLALHRSAFGDLKLDPDLEPGEYRELTLDEIEMIKKK